MEELVFKSSKGNPITTSLLVAQKFEKNHKDVLRDIQNLSCSQAFRERNFALSYYKSRQNKELPMYIMTKDGFTFLVMGYTGETAGQFKEDFIDAFNSMENKLKQITSLPDFNNPVAAARAWADEAEQKALAQATAKKFKDKADFADRVIDAGNMVDIGQAAKLLNLGFGRNTFFKKLREDKIFFNSRNEPKQQYTTNGGSGYFSLKEIEIPRDNHLPMAITKVLVTQKGLYWLSKKYGGDFHDGIPQLKIQ